jgi:hypothetical protein
MVGFRAHPKENSSFSEELLDIEVDPYAYFMDSTSTRNYRDALSARGLPAQGSPDRGHAFESVRHELFGTYSLTRATDHWGNAIVSYDGSRLDSVHNGSAMVMPTEGDLLPAFANRAYQKTAPTSVVFDAASFFGETLQNLPNLPFAALKDSTRFFRGLGNEYVNLSFGWIPFVTDIVNAAKALGLATQQLTENGRRVHRKYGIPRVSRYESLSPGLVGQFDLGLYVGNNGNLPVHFDGLDSLRWPTVNARAISAGNLEFYSPFISKGYTRDQWFEGEFTSFYPLDFNPDDYLSRLNVLVNTKLTPEVLWELTPWSWLADWTLRIGDSIRANQLRANDLLIMHYGYAMERTVFTTFLNLYDPYFVPASSIPFKMKFSSRTTRKRRIRANPYGFTVGGASALSVEQLAILGALGLSRL